MQYLGVKCFIKFVAKRTKPEGLALHHYTLSGQGEVLEAKPQ